MAVYTHISAEDLQKHLSLFDIGTPVSFAGITEGIDNTNYLLTTTSGKFILTLFEKRIHPQDLPFFLSFMNHLRGHGIPCPLAIAAKTGAAVVSFNGQPSAITTFLPGQWPRKIEAFHLPEIGALLARMHTAGKDFSMTRPNDMSLPAWKTRINTCGSRADVLQPGLSQLLQQELSYQEKNSFKSLPSGAIHADLFPDNVFFSGQSLTGVIDFYFSCTDAYAYDLMIAVNAWCFDNGIFDAKKFSALLNAYEKIRVLEKAERAALQALGRAAALRIIATRLYDWLHPVPGALIELKDPMEYVRILRFHQTMEVSL